MKAEYKAKGLGSSIERFTEATGIKKIVDKVSKATGKDCGCGKRRDFLNNPDHLVNKVLYNNKEK